MNKIVRFPPKNLESADLPDLAPAQLSWLGHERIGLEYGRYSDVFEIVYQPEWTEQTFRKSQIEVWQIAREMPARNVLLVLPYFDPKRLHLLRIMGVNGIDLCGNAIVFTAEYFLYISGLPNQFQRESNLVNPYLGKAGLVTRAILQQPAYSKIKDLQRRIEAHGGSLTQGMVSRTLQALEADFVIATKPPWRVRLLQPDVALDALAQAWSKVKPKLLWRGRVNAPLEDFLPQIFGNASQRVVMTGVGSATRHTTLSLEDTAYLYAESMSGLLREIQAEPTERFPNLEIRECKDPGPYFDMRVDDRGVRWSSPLQTYLEGTNGDARLRDAVIPLRARLIAENRVRLLEAV